MSCLVVKISSSQCVTVMTLTADSECMLTGITIPHACVDHQDRQEDKGHREASAVLVISITIAPPQICNPDSTELSTFNLGTPFERIASDNFETPGNRMGNFNLNTHLHVSA